MPDLADEVDDEVSVSFDGGRANNLSDLSCSIGSIVASFLAAVLAAVNGAPGWLTAIIAAMPGLCTSLQRLVDFRGRSAWYFVKYAKLRDLALAIKFDDSVSTSEAAHRFGAILREMEERWSEFVKTGAAPAAKSAPSSSAPAAPTAGTTGTGS
jgi:hypothetical protein